jgi:hypothetical protein
LKGTNVRQKYAGKLSDRLSYMPPLLMVGFFLLLGIAADAVKKGASGTTITALIILTMVLTIGTGYCIKVGWPIVKVFFNGRYRRVGG